VHEGSGSVQGSGVGDSKLKATRLYKLEILNEKAFILLFAKNTHDKTVGFWVEPSSRAAALIFGSR